MIIENPVIIVFMNVRAYYKAKEDQLSLEINDILSHVEHNDLEGRHAEELLKRYLQSVLPQKYGVGTGLVTGINADNKFDTSKEVDIIIYDKLENAPLQEMGGFNIYPAEAVCAIITVKISATTGTILTGKCNAFDNIRSVKRIPREKFSPKKIAPGISGGQKTDDIISCVFAFKSGVDIGTLQKNIIKKWKSEERSFLNFPDMLTVLDAGNIFINPAKHDITMDDNPIVDPFPRITNTVLEKFTCFLITLLSKQSLSPVNLFDYAQAEE